MQGIFFESPLCLPTATVISCLLCLPVAVSVRHLADSVGEPSALLKLYQSHVISFCSLLWLTIAYYSLYYASKQVLLCFVNLFLILAVLAIVRSLEEMTQ